MVLPCSLFLQPQASSLSENSPAPGVKATWSSVEVNIMDIYVYTVYTVYMKINLEHKQKLSH